MLLLCLLRISTVVLVDCVRRDLRCQLSRASRANKAHACRDRCTDEHQLFIHQLSNWKRRDQSNDRQIGVRKAGRLNTRLTNKRAPARERGCHHEKHGPRHHTSFTTFLVFDSVDTTPIGTITYSSLMETRISNSHSHVCKALLQLLLPLAHHHGEKVSRRLDACDRLCNPAAGKGWREPEGAPWTAGRSS